jgi:hypothetical protein
VTRDVYTKVRVIIHGETNNKSRRNKGERK